MIGVRQAHISNFVLGRRGLSVDRMDAILTVLGLNVASLLAMSEQTEALKDNPNAFDGVPLIQLRSAMNTKFAQDEVLGISRVAQPLLRLLKSEPPEKRKLWVRFVAVRADTELSEPMRPRLGNNSVLLIDRHYCSLVGYRKDEPNLYLIRKGEMYLVRRVEVQGNQLCLRPENCNHPLDFICINRKNTIRSVSLGGWLT